MTALDRSLMSFSTLPTAVYAVISADIPQYQAYLCVRWRCPGVEASNDRQTSIITHEPGLGRVFEFLKGFRRECHPFVFQDVNLQHLVRKILVNKLKQQRLEAPAANADAGGVFTVDSTLPGPVPATTAPSVDVNSEPSDVDVDAGAVSALDSESDDDDKFDFEDEEASEEECDQDDLDLAVLQTMPRDMQLKRAGGFSCVIVAVMSSAC